MERPQPVAMHHETDHGTERRIVRTPPGPTSLEHVQDGLCQEHVAAACPRQVGQGDGQPGRRNTNALAIALDDGTSLQ